MGIATQHLQRMLDDAWDAATDGADTLRDSLRAQEKTVGELLASGQIQSVSKNSASHSYAFGGGTLTLNELAQGWRDLINLFDYCREVIADDAQAINDDNIVAEMRARLVPRYSDQTNMALLHNSGLPPSAWPSDSIG